MQQQIRQVAAECAALRERPPAHNVRNSQSHPSVGVNGGNVG